ncbi:MAG: universal stress protein [Caldimonas sp.]
MAIKTILVHLDPTPRCAVRVSIAAQLARSFGSHLVGLAPTGRADITLSMSSAIPDGLEFVQLSARYLRGRAEASADAFRARVEPLVLPSFEALIVQDQPVDAVVELGRCSDLVVVGQSEPGTVIESVERDFAQQVLMNVGRPVIVVPFAGEFASVGRRVLVAWNGGREAAVAARDALPFLQAANHVELLSIGRLQGDTGGRRNGLDDAQRWLARHGVDARCREASDAGDVGETLLSRAADLGADLVVMGAYGHSRMRQWALGGATRSMLAHMTVPVLMAR